MLRREAVTAAIADIEQDYVAFMCENLKDWRQWARASNRMEQGEAVAKEAVPAFFHSEYEWARLVLEMEPQGSFDWNDPRIAGLFAQAVQTPFYRLWGETITEIALRLSDIMGARTLVEAGAGRANLTSIMLQKLSARERPPRLVTTDAHATVLENIERLRADHPGVPQETHVWDLNSAPPPALCAAVPAPALLYERASLTYANYTAVRNCAEIADVVVLGDYFNYTGELFAYDTIFEKIGLQPLMYRDVAEVLQDCFPNHYILDRKVNETLQVPTVSLIIAWK